MSQEINYVIVGKRIQKVREKNGITQDGLANNILNISRSAVAMYESGKRPIPLEDLEKIAKEFNVSENYLLGKTDIASTNPDYITIYNLTGLTDEAIEALNELKYSNKKSLLNTINFLIEQESRKKNRPFDGNPRVIIEKENYTQKELEKAESKAFEKYYKEEESWYEKQFPILRILHEYFTSKVKETDKIYITKEKVTMERTLLSNKIVTTNAIADKVYFDEINKKIKKAKEEYPKE